MPFATSTITCPSGTKGRVLAAVDRANTDRDRKQQHILSGEQTYWMLFVKAISAGDSCIPGRLGWVRLALKASISCSSADHTVTSLPFPHYSIRASAMPQVPAPRRSDSCSSSCTLPPYPPRTVRGRCSCPAGQAIRLYCTPKPSAPSRNSIRVVWRGRPRLPAKLHKAADTIYWRLFHDGYFSKKHLNSHRFHVIVNR